MFKTPLLSSRARLKSISFPFIPSADLAYFCGIMAGDGHICVREEKADYYLTIEGNPADEQSFYQLVVCPLVKRVFNIDVCPIMFQHTYGIRIRSKALIQYLVDSLGLPKNRKYSQLRIPDWVKSDVLFLLNYVRGLADTDFCLSLKRRYNSVPYYPVVSGCSESKRFMEEIAKVLESFGFRVSRHFDYKYPDSRLKAGFYVHHRIYLYGHDQLVKWMSLIGFYSPKHLAKFELWRLRNKKSGLGVPSGHIAGGGFEFGA